MLAANTVPQNSIIKRRLGKLVFLSFLNHSLTSRTTRYAVSQFGARPYAGLIISAGSQVPRPPNQADAKSAAGHCITLISANLVAGGFKKSNCRR
jgi:hypothetical protein